VCFQDAHKFCTLKSDSLQPWLRWANWTSPFTYAQNAIALNEFLDERWAIVSNHFNYPPAKICLGSLNPLQVFRSTWSNILDHMYITRNHLIMMIVHADRNSITQMLIQLVKLYSRSGGCSRSGTGTGFVSAFYLDSHWSSTSSLYLHWSS
jgi:hypothetical protein